MVWVWRYLDKDIFFVTNTAYPYQELVKKLGKRIEKQSTCLLFPPGQAPAQLEEDLNRHAIEYVLGSPILAMDISPEYYQKILKEGKIFP